MFARIKAWTGWKEAGSIFMARLEVALGFLLGVFSCFDWDRLLGIALDPGFSWRAALITGGVMVLKGVLAEVTRRHGATDLGDVEKQ